MLTSWIPTKISKIIQYSNNTGGFWHYKLNHAPILTYIEYLFADTIELKDLLFLCGDDAAETDAEIAGDLVAIPGIGTPAKRACS